MLRKKEEQNDQGVNWIASTVSYLLVGFILSGNNKRMSGRQAIKESQIRRLREFREDLIQSNGNIRSILLGLRKSPSTNETRYKMRMLEGYLRRLKPRRISRKKHYSASKSTNNTIINSNSSVNQHIGDTPNTETFVSSTNTGNPPNSQGTELASENEANENQEGGKRRKPRKTRKLRR